MVCESSLDRKYGNTDGHTSQYRRPNYTIVDNALLTGSFRNQFPGWSLGIGRMKRMRFWKQPPGGKKRCRAKTPIQPSSTRPRSNVTSRHVTSRRVTRSRQMAPRCTAWRTFSRHRNFGCTRWSCAIYGRWRDSHLTLFIIILGTD